MKKLKLAGTLLLAATLTFTACNKDKGKDESEGDKSTSTAPVSINGDTTEIITNDSIPQPGESHLGDDSRAADETTEVEITGTVNGDELNVKVNLVKNEGIIAYAFGVKYDPELLELVYADEGDGLLSAGDAPFYSNKITDIPYVILCIDALSKTDYTAAPVCIMNVKFKIKAVGGEKLEVSITDPDFSNTNTQSVDVAIPAPFVHTMA